MDAQQSPDATRRPQIYVHFEFGVSYSPRRPGNRHSLTYMSRNWRDRTGFPRQLPPTNTNYLEFTSIPAHEQQQQQQPTQPRFQPHPQAEAQPQSQTRTPPRPLPDSHPELQLQPGAQLLQQVDTPAEPTQRAASPRGRQRSVAHPNLPVSQTLLYPPFNRRQSRADSHSSGSSHERGTSAPPPWNQSPWDAEPEPMGASALPRREATQHERPSHERCITSADVWKALPAIPTSYRLSEHLGDGGVPWSTGWPTEFGVPDGQDEQSLSEGEFVPFANQPTVIQVTSDSRTTLLLHEDPTREAEMEDLSNAMMTVDNGFETQWWNQGPRAVVSYSATGEPVLHSPVEPMPEAIPIPEDAEMTARSVGWAIAQQPYGSLPSTGAGFNFVTVSPVTVTDASSPQFWAQQSGQHPRMQRSLTIRSDELFFAV